MEIVGILDIGRVQLLAPSGALLFYVPVAP
jgi:hypothetical protein